MPFRVRGKDRATGDVTEYVSNARSEQFARKSAETLGIEVEAIENIAGSEPILKPEPHSTPVRSTGSNATEPRRRRLGAAFTYFLFLLVGLATCCYTGIQLPSLSRAYADARRQADDARKSLGWFAQNSTALVQSAQSNRFHVWFEQEQTAWVARNWCLAALAAGLVVTIASALLLRHEIQGRVVARYHF